MTAPKVVQKNALEISVKIKLEKKITVNVTSFNLTLFSFQRILKLLIN